MSTVILLFITSQSTAFIQTHKVSYVNLDNLASLFLSDGDPWSCAPVRHSAVKFLCNALVVKLYILFQHEVQVLHVLSRKRVQKKTNKGLFCNLDTSRYIFVCVCMYPVLQEIIISIIATRNVSFFCAKVNSSKLSQKVTFAHTCVNV